MNIFNQKEHSLAHQIPLLRISPVCLFLCLNNFFPFQKHSIMASQSQELFSQASTSQSQDSQPQGTTPKRKRDSLVKAENIKVSSPDDDIRMNLSTCVNKILHIYEGTALVKGKFYPARAYMRLNRWATNLDSGMGAIEVCANVLCLCVHAVIPNLFP